MWQRHLQSPARCQCERLITDFEVRREASKASMQSMVSSCFIRHKQTTSNTECPPRTCKCAAKEPGRCAPKRLKIENAGKSCRRHVDVFALAMGDPGRARAKILAALDLRRIDMLFSLNTEEAAEFVTSFCLSVTTSWSLPHGPYLQTDVMVSCIWKLLNNSQCPTYHSLSRCTTLTTRVL